MKQLTVAENQRMLQPLDKTMSRHKRLLEATVKFIYQDMQPLSVVEGNGFRNLMAVAEPCFIIPSRTHFTKTEIPRCM